ncbi:MAG: hypothetical protein HYY16_05315 [Planctomycetes bacterium]|nr:hypothetical protein [Planctomycetota bacterium]
MLIVMVVLNLALVVVFLEARGTKLRYALARKREAVRAETLENRKWMLAVAKARRPEALARQAARFGLTIKDEERGETGEVARDRRRP